MAELQRISKQLDDLEGGDWLYYIKRRKINQIAPKTELYDNFGDRGTFKTWSDKFDC